MKPVLNDQSSIRLRLFFLYNYMLLNYVTKMLFGHKYCSLNVKNLLIYKHYKNKESYNESKIPMHRIYNGKKTTSLTSGAGKTGQPLVTE